MGQLFSVILYSCHLNTYIWIDYISRENKLAHVTAATVFLVLRGKKLLTFTLKYMTLQFCLICTFFSYVSYNLNWTAEKSLHLERVCHADVNLTEN